MDLCDQQQSVPSSVSLLSFLLITTSLSVPQSSNDTDAEALVQVMHTGTSLAKRSVWPEEK